MGWDAIGALAEIFGAVAVVISLLYLARQVRLSTRVESTAAFQALNDGIAQHVLFMFGPSNVELAAKGLRSW